MSGESNGKVDLYQVSYSVSVAKGIQELAYQAFLEGQRDRFDAAIATIIRRLKNDPWGFGELVQSLHHLKLAIHVASVPPVTVRFAIHREKPLVFIAKVLLITPA